MTWQNRIMRYSDEPPDQLLANPKNYRTHPGSQADALRGVLQDVGVVQNVLANERTGYLIDGHLRVMEALKSGQPTVPVTWVDLSEAEEALILATLDPLSAMAGTDAAQLDALLREVSTDSPALQAMLDEIAQEAGIVPGELTDDEPQPLAVEAPDLLFPSDNEWGIPLLQLHGQPEGLPMPVERWGKRTRGSQMLGTWHFYTDDYKFNALWDDPTLIVHSGCRAIVEPNISTGPHMPAAVALWGIYRKRWLARWAQQYGVAVFVDLNVDPAFARLNLLGVPKGWRHYATRSIDAQSDLLEADYQIAQTHANGEPIVFMVVGGGQVTHTRCKERGWVHIPQEVHVIEGRYPNGEE